VPSPVRLALLLAFALLVAPVSALAADAPSQAELEQATKDFKEAQKKYDSKDYAGALELARAALEVTGSPNARLYVARSLRELGKNAEAYDEMSITLRETTERAQSEPKYVPTRDAAAAELALLGRKVGRVIIAVADPPPGTRVEMNDAAIDDARLGQPIAVEPGSLRVRATAKGQEPIERNIEIAAGEVRTLALAFGAAASDEDEPEPEPAPAPDRPAPAASGGGVRTLGFVVAGVGVAGMAAFAIAGSMAKSEFDTIEEECGGDRCTDPKYADDVDRGKRLETIANVGLVVGAIGLIAGGTMIVLGGPKQKEGAGLMVSPGGLGVGYRGRF
jgi:hypothetical protein